MGLLWVGGGMGVGGVDWRGQHSGRARRLSPTSKGTAWNQNLEYEFLAVDIEKEDGDDDNDDSWW